MDILRSLFPKISSFPLLVTVCTISSCLPAEHLKDQAPSALLTRESHLPASISSLHDQMQRLLVAKEEDIKYELIVKDILRIFKWLDSDTLKPVFWSNFIRGQYCESSCQLIIEDPSEESVYKGGSFAGMGSNKYISSVLLYLNEDNSKVNEVSIVLKRKYSKNFEVSKIYPLLTNEKFIPFTGAKLGGCDRPCRGGSREYRININDKFFSRSVTKHNLKIVMGVDIISGIGKPRNTYKFSKEFLTLINLH